MKHMTEKRKAVILYAITEGHISESEACHDYGLSYDELTEWMRRYALAGVEALRVKNTPKYRSMHA
jgi:transposase